MNALLERLRPWLPGRRALLEIGGATLLAAALVLLGLRGWRAGQLEREATLNLEALLAATSGWGARIEPVTAAERESWSASREALHELAADPKARLTLLDVVAQRASDVGIPDARVTFVGAPRQAARVARGWDVQPADYGLRVTFAGDYWSVVAFVGSLPPVLEVGTLQLGRLEGQLMADMVLAVYRSVEEAATGGRPETWEPREWERLERYLKPAASPAAVTALGDFGEGRDPFSRASAPPPPRPVATQPERVWVVSAIMITERRRIAVIDGQVVAAGDSLPGGARVTAIEPGRVLIQDRNGRTRELRVNRSNAP